MNAKIREMGFEAITTDGIHLTETGQRMLAQIVKESFCL